MIQACFVNSDNPPISTRHVGWTVVEDGNNLILYEVVEEKFPHPDTPEMFVFLQTTIQKSIHNRDSKRASSLRMLLECQNVCTEIFGSAKGH